MTQLLSSIQQEYEFFVIETEEVLCRQICDGRVGAAGVAIALQKEQESKGLLLTIEVRCVERLFCVNPGGGLNIVKRPELPVFQPFSLGVK